MSIGILISLAGPGPSHPFSLIYWGWPQECICLNTGLNAEWIASFFSRFFLLPVFLKFCNRLSSCVRALVRACVCVRRSLPRSLSPPPLPPSHSSTSIIQGLQQDPFPPKKDRAIHHYELHKRAACSISAALA